MRTRWRVNTLFWPKSETVQEKLLTPKVIMYKKGRINLTWGFLGYIFEFSSPTMFLMLFFTTGAKGKVQNFIAVVNAKVSNVKFLADPCQSSPTVSDSFYCPIRKQNEYSERRDISWFDWKMSRCLATILPCWRLQAQLVLEELSANNPYWESISPGS